jgi:lipoprotein-releasing system ATP-binding protein
MRLELKEVEKTYSDGERRLTIIERLSFLFPESGSVAIVGQSGVGKSTLLNLIGALDSPTSGVVLHDSRDVAKLTPAARAVFRGSSVGFILQSHALLPEFNALENVAMPGLLSGLAEGEAMARAKKILGELGLADRISSYPAQLSGGEQQRVAIARSLVMNQRLVLADEPTGSLDVKTAAAVQHALFSACRSTNALLVLVTHSADLAAMCDHRYEMMPGGSLRRL